MRANELKKSKRVFPLVVATGFFVVISSQAQAANVIQKRMVTQTVGTHFSSESRVLFLKGCHQATPESSNSVALRGVIQTIDGSMTCHFNYPKSSVLADRNICHSDELRFSGRVIERVYENGTFSYEFEIVDYQRPYLRSPELRAKPYAMECYTKSSFDAYHLNLLGNVAVPKSRLTFEENATSRAAH